MRYLNEAGQSRTDRSTKEGFYLVGFVDDLRILAGIKTRVSLFPQSFVGKTENGCIWIFFLSGKNDGF